VKEYMGQYDLNVDYNLDFDEFRKVFIDDNAPLKEIKEEPIAVHEEPLDEQELPTAMTRSKSVVVKKRKG
jgi:hypothetical protein